MRGIHVQAFQDVSFSGSPADHTVEINFAPSYVVAKGALTGVFGTGSGRVGISAVRRRGTRGDVKESYPEDRAYIWGADVTGVTFRRLAYAEKQKAVAVSTITEVQFW